MEINDMIGSRHRLNQAQLDQIAEIVRSTGEYKSPNAVISAKHQFAKLTHGAFKGHLEENDIDRRGYLIQKLRESGISILEVIRKTNQT